MTKKSFLRALLIVLALCAVMQEPASAMDPRPAENPEEQEEISQEEAQADRRTLAALKIRRQEELREIAALEECLANVKREIGKQFSTNRQLGRRLACLQSILSQKSVYNLMETLLSTGEDLVMPNAASARLDEQQKRSSLPLYDPEGEKPEDMPDVLWSLVQDCHAQERIRILEEKLLISSYFPGFLSVSEKAELDYRREQDPDKKALLKNLKDFLKTKECLEDSLSIIEARIKKMEQDEPELEDPLPTIGDSLAAMEAMLEARVKASRKRMEQDKPASDADRTRLLRQAERLKRKINDVNRTIMQVRRALEKRN